MTWKEFVCTVFNHKLVLEFRQLGPRRQAWRLRCQRCKKADPYKLEPEFNNTFKPHQCTDISRGADSRWRCVECNAEYYFTNTLTSRSA